MSHTQHTPRLGTPHRAALLIACAASLILSACADAGFPARLTAPQSPPGAAVANDEKQVTPEPAISTDDEPLLPDRRVRIGRLENGLTYYIRPNFAPPNRAELWLAVNAGSVLETDSEKGVAHFVEHMLFNGTRNFPGLELIDFLEKMGIEFGPDINAYTSFDETVYQLQIPTDDPALIETAVAVLRDWAGEALFDPAEVDAERGVVIEEWRLRSQTASGRLSEQQIKLLLEGSLYAERLPIGDMDVIRTISAEAVRAFYQKWYRPDLMAVMAVGDFDPAEIEGLIEEYFGDLPSAQDAIPRPAPAVPQREDTRYLIATDPENPYAYAMLINSMASNTAGTRAGYRQFLASQLVSSMLNRRLDEARQQPDAPFSGAYASRGSLVRGVDVSVLAAQTDEAGILDGVAALLTEAERIQRHGFTETELDQARSTVLRQYEELRNQSGNLSSSYLAAEFVRNYLTGEAMPGIAAEYDLAESLLPGITVSDVNALASDMFSTEGRAIIVVTPEKAGVAPVTQADIEAVVARVAASDIALYAGQSSRDALMDKAPAPAAIISERIYPDLGVTEITLANGARVLMRPSAGIQNQVLLSGFSPGGSSLVSDEDYPEAATIVEIVTQSGLGDLSQPELSQVLSRLVAQVTPYIGALSEGFMGYASRQDLETAFQMVYLYATRPRAEPAALSALQTRRRADLANKDLDPETVYEDAIAAARCGSGIRCGTLPLKQIESIDLQRAFEIYQDRFSDLGDARWVIVGDFDIETVKELARRYLGALPTTGRREHWRNVTQPLSPQDASKTIYQGQAERSLASLIYTGSTDTTLRTRLRLRVLERILDIRLREVIREERSGSYAPFASANFSRVPEPGFTTRISFLSDPQRVEELLDVARQLVNELRTAGPSADDLAKVKEQLARNYEIDSQGNAYWLDVLQSSDSLMNGARLSLRYLNILDSLTVEDVRRAADEYLRDDQVARIVLYPAIHQQHTGRR